VTQLIVSGKTVEGAIEKAVQELGTAKEQLTYRVIEEPKKGFLGFIGSRLAKIEACVKPDPVEEAFIFLQQLLEKMEVNVEVTKREKDGACLFQLQGIDDIGRIIGKRGQTLDSLEYLTNLVANRQHDKYVKIELDAENYRKKRKQALQQLAQRVGKKVRLTNQKTKLEPMNGIERKIIHSVVQGLPEVVTYSQGQGLNRHVVIAPKK
jgi:spoIIIJ-associated protein